MPHSAWAGVPVPIGTGSLEVEFLIKGRKFIRDNEGKVSFVVALEPAAVVLRTDEQASVVELNSSADSATAASPDTGSPLPRAKAEVLDLTLGMPIEEAIARLEKQFVGMTTKKIETQPSWNFGSPSPCDFVDADVRDAVRAKVQALPVNSPERDRAMAEGQAAIDLALDEKQCENGPRSATVFAYGLVITHGDALVERIYLHKSGARLGPSVLSMVYRMVPKPFEQAFTAGLKQKYGPAISPDGYNLYWSENPIYRSAFMEMGRCLSFWGSSPPDTQTDQPCGSLVRSKYNEMYLIDTNFVATARALAVKARLAVEGNSAKPVINFDFNNR